MKRFITIVMMVGILVYPHVCFSAYRITLINEETFWTNHYWKENGQIKFYHEGGVLGIDEYTIQEIKDSDLDAIFKQPSSEKKEEGPASTGISSISIKKEKAPLPIPNKRALLDERDDLKAEIKLASDAYREAKTKRDTKLIQEQRKKLFSLQADLGKLRNRVRAAYGGHVPDWFDKSE